MKYKIIVDKQSREKPSNKKKEYLIDIEELRVKNNIYDSLVITKEEAYVIRRLNLSDLHVLTMLKKEVKEPLEDLSIELFEGENYIYLLDMTGNKFYAEYIVKNEFTDMYVTNTEMNSAINQTANSIDLAVNQKLTSYSTIEELIKAKEEAIDTTNSNTTNKLKNYSTTVEMNSAINMKANEITSTVSETYSTKTETNAAKEEAINSANNNTKDKLKDYSTTTQMNSKIEQTAKEINSIVSKKIGEDELGTKIEQNWEHVKYAWNQISEFIQMEILNGNASIAFKKDSNNLLMALDKLGQHFYDSDGKVFGEIGVKTVDNQNYIAFSVPSDYNKDILDGMAWGMTTSSDNKFFPILYIKNFHTGPKNSGDWGGQLILNACDLVLRGMETGIATGNIRMYGNIFNGITFEDTELGKSLLTIAPQNDMLDGMQNGMIQILDKIVFYANAGGSNSFKIGDNNNYILLTDDGIISTTQDIYGKSVILDGSKSKLRGGAQIGSNDNRVGCSIYGDLKVEHGKVYANDFISDRRVKKNIKNSKKNALSIIKKIKHKQFEMKENNKHYNIGYIAQEMEKIDSNFISIREKTENEEERYYINELPIIATATKAIQEQQEQIEQLQEKDKQKEDLIQSLIRRIEKLEVQDEKN